MTVLSIILGVLLILGGIGCMFTPLATFLSTGYFLAIMLIVYGVAIIVRVCRKEAGALELVLAVLAILAGLLAIFRPGQTLVFDRLILYMIAAWMLVQGCVSLFMSIRVRHECPGWFWGVIVGVLGIILGIYSFAHPMVTALSTGILIGLYFIEMGIDTIVLGTAIGQIERM